MAKLAKKFLVTAKKETLPGTFSNPTNSEAFEVFAPAYGNDQPFTEVDKARLSLDRPFSTPGTATDTVSFQMEVRGSGEVTNLQAQQAPSRAPRLFKLLEACGCSLENMARLEVAALTVQIEPNSIVYGDVSGARARVLRRGSVGDTFLLIEPLSIYGFKSAEWVRLNTANTGTVVATVRTVVTGTEIISGPYGWFLRPASRPINRMTVKNTVAGEFPAGDAWKVTNERWGTVIKIQIPNIRKHIPWGTTLIGATTGARAITIEDHPSGQDLNFTAVLAVSCLDGTIVTGGTSGAVAKCVGSRLATIHDSIIVRRGYRITCGANLAAALSVGDTIQNATSGATKTARVLVAAGTGQAEIWVEQLTGADFAATDAVYKVSTSIGTVASIAEINFSNGETVTWTGGGTGVLKAASTNSAIPAGVPTLQVRAQMVTGSVDFSGAEVLQGTGANTNPTILYVDCQIELVAPLVGIIAAGTVVTGATSGASAIVHDAMAAGQDRLLVFRTTAANFIAGETINGSGLGTAPVASRVNLSMYAVPHPGAVLKGLTSGAIAYVRNPQSAALSGKHNIPFSAALAPVGYTRKWTDPDELYFEPAYGTFVANETLQNLATGNSVKVTEAGAAFVLEQAEAPTLSVIHNLDGHRRGMVGARGTARVEGKAGEAITANFDFLGRFYLNDDLEIDPEIPPGGTPDFGDTSETIQFEAMKTGFEACVSDFSFDLGTSRALRLCAAAGDGVEQIDITDRRPKLTVTIDRQAVGVKDWIGIMRAAVSGAVSNVRYLESPFEAGNTFGLCVPNSQLVAVADSERDGISQQKLEFEARTTPNSGGDDSWWMVSF